MPRPLVICPLELEANQIRPIVGDRAEVIVGGLGPRAAATLQGRCDSGAAPSLVILAGVCGGLAEHLAGHGHAVRIACVVSLRGDSWRCPLVWAGERRAAPSGVKPRPAEASPGAAHLQAQVPIHALYAHADADPATTLVGVDELIDSPRAKQALGQRASAAYVDMESHHVARVCEALGIPWGVARGVSDDASTHAPKWLEKSITPEGGVRTGFAARNLLLRPWQLPGLLRLMRATNEAARAAGRAAAEMLDAAAGEPSAARSASAPIPVPPDAKRVLVVGGTFDPPHRGHVTLAREAAAAVGADWRLYIPAARSPFKDEGPSASDEERREMLKLALAGETRVSVSTVEMDRAKTALAGLAAHGRGAVAGEGATRPEPSYTIDTLRQLRGQLASHVTLRLLLGADQAAEFHRWKDARGVIALAEPVIVLREPFTTPQALLTAMAPHWSPAEMEQWRGRIVHTSLTPAASTTLRESAPGATGASDSATNAWDRDVAPAVRAYIEVHGLYRRDNPRRGA